MNSSRYCASDVSLRAAARCRASSLAMTSPSKKSLRAEERERADVARAPTLIREQGWLDTTPTNIWCALTAGAPAENDWSRTRPMRALGDRNVYRWPASNWHRGSDGHQRGHEWRIVPGL